jgi:drug/metabolite transporter (DMT)-like permease
MTSPAFLLAGGAILLWSSLALISSRLGHLPPILTAGIALFIGGLIGIIRVREWRVSAVTLLVGIGGIFGYHLMLFTAFRLSPMLEANLINYLWPLLIVLFTPLLLPGFGLRTGHVAGAVMGLAGAALIVTGGSIHPDLSALPGYLLAAAAAVTWAVYSLLTKRLPAFGSGAVGAFCLAAGTLSLGVYAAHAGTAGFAVIRTGDWPLLLLLGVGPMGTAFFLWDAALKRGDPRVIGSLSYVTPLLSTLALALAGGRRLSLLSAAAMALIIAGAAVGSLSPGKRTVRRADR